MNTPKALKAGFHIDHAASGPWLHDSRIVDRLVRMYAYTLVYLGDIDPAVQPAHSKRLSYRNLYHFFGACSELYPGLFRTYREYPEAFSVLDEDALKFFVRRLPYSISAWELDKVVRRLTGCELPPLLGMNRKPSRTWMILELPGSMGRYTSLLCRAYPELELPRNGTILARNEFGSREAPLESAAAHINALMSCGFELGDTHYKSYQSTNLAERAVSSSPPATFVGHDRYDLIIAPRRVLSEPAQPEYISPERLEDTLTSTGKLIVLDVPEITVEKSVQRDASYETMISEESAAIVDE